ncbi:MAG: hypothetical protein JXR63_12300 [Spirochaetales bacterium]|nr:hypothetical protein [Spirochaetales bacterium]
MNKKISFIKITYIMLLLAITLVIAGCKDSILNEMEQISKGEIELSPVMKQPYVIDEEESLYKDDPMPTSSIPAPSNLYIEGVGLTGDLTLNWRPVEYGDSKVYYNIYRSTDGVNFQRLRAELESSLYPDTTIEVGVDYYYAVKTVVREKVGTTEKIKTSPYSFLAHGYTLGYVTGQAASYLDYTDRVDVNWNPVPGARAYEVRRRTTTPLGDWELLSYEVEPKFVDLVKDLGGKATPGQRYEYKISAISKNNVARETIATCFGLARLAASPDRVKETTIVIGKAWFKDAIYVSWGGVSGSAKYNVYSSLTTENTSFTTPIANSPSDSKTYALDEFVENDVNAIGTKRVYYRVSSLNEYSYEGQLSNLNSSTHYGTLLASPDVFVPRIYNSENLVKVTWSEVANATSYMIFKSEPVFIGDSAPSNFASWKYYSSTEGEEWQTMTFGFDQIDLDNVSTFKEHFGTSFVDTAIPEANTQVYYRIIPLNSIAMDFAQEGEILHAFRDKKPGIGGQKTAVAINLPANPQEWLIVSDVTSTNSSLKNLALANPGYNAVVLDIPDEYVSLLPAVNLKVTRTYRYGDGHQGYNASKTDRSSHTALNNPDPANIPWEKTIDVIVADIDTTPELFTTGSLEFKDNLADRIGGEDVYAVWLKTHTNAGGANPWYERKENNIDGDYVLVRNPDGQPEGHEWHYLKWDWVVRKYMNNPGNPNQNSNRFARVNLLEAVRCDYRIELTWKESELSVSDKVVSTPVYGIPALTPREFTSLAFFIREVAFYKIPMSFLDEVYEQGVGNADTSDKNVPGKIEGRLKMWGGSLDLFALTIKANAATEDGPSGIGVVDFPGIGIKLSWNIALKLGGEPRRSIDGSIFDIFTPFGNGKLQLWADLLGGTYQHGVYGGDIRVTYNNYSNQKVELGICNEYGGTNGWQRASGSSPADYDNRYTSVGWEVSGKTYPGF